MKTTKIYLLCSIFEEPPVLAANALTRISLTVSFHKTHVVARVHIAFISHGQTLVEVHIAWILSARIPVRILRRSSNGSVLSICAEADVASMVCHWKPLVEMIG